MNTPEREKFEAWCDKQIFPQSWKEDDGARTAFEARNEEVKELEAEIEQMTATTNYLTGRVEQLQAQVANHPKELLEARIDEVTYCWGSVGARIDGLRASLAALEGEK